MKKDLLDETVEKLSERDLLNATNKDDSDEDIATGIIRLKKPLLVEGEEIKEIQYDFGQIKPISYINLVQRVQKKEGTIALPELNPTVQLGMFSLASQISMNDLKRIEYLPDYTSICRTARDFLLDESEKPDHQ